MKVQKIAGTSINTTKNTQGATTTFLRGQNKSLDCGMPTFRARTPKQTVNSPKTVYEELKNLIIDTSKAIKQSYDKSETKKVVVKPMQKAWNNFSAKAPNMAQNLKCMAWGVMCVGLYEAMSTRQNKS